MAAKTFDQMINSLDSWARESVDRDVAADALNDAISRVWRGIIRAQIEMMVQGPVNPPTIAAAAERVQLISVADPTIAPIVNPAVVGGLAQHTVYVSYTYVTESGSETNPSPVTGPTVIAVNNVASIPAPARPAPPFLGASSVYGWNCYAGSTVANMCRQNSAPLPFSAAFQEAADIGFIDQGDANQPGPLPPIENSTADDVFYIRHLEVPLETAGTYKKWNQASIDSMMWQWASRSIASTSIYQPYYYDLINGRQLEFRPALGTQFNPRYFFIHKPRRISFGGAPIPFTTIDVEACLRSYTIADWKLTNDEFQTADRWSQRGDKELSDILQTICQQNWDKDTTITPFVANSDF